MFSPLPNATWRMEAGITTVCVAIGGGKTISLKGVRRRLAKDGSSKIKWLNYDYL